MASLGLCHCLNVLPLTASGLGKASLVWSYLSQITVDLASLELSEEGLRVPTVRGPSKPCAAWEQWM